MGAAVTLALGAIIYAIGTDYYGGSQSELIKANLIGFAGIVTCVCAAYADSATRHREQTPLLPNDSLPVSTTGAPGQPARANIV